MRARLLQRPPRRIRAAPQPRTEPYGRVPRYQSYGRDPGQDFSTSRYGDLPHDWYGQAPQQEPHAHQTPRTSADLASLRSACRVLRRVSTLTALGSCVVYVVLPCYAPDLMGSKITGELSLGMALGVLQLVVTLAAAFWYGRSAERSEELPDAREGAAVLRLVREKGGPQPPKDPHQWPGTEINNLRVLPTAPAWPKPRGRPCAPPAAGARALGALEARILTLPCTSGDDSGRWSPAQHRGFPSL